MPVKFQNKYRIESIRLKNWDYGSNAMYFITICTKDREFFFGKIANGMMQLSESGEIARHYWYEIPRYFPFVRLCEFVVMPDHVHGIVIINKSDGGGCNCGSDDGYDGRDAINRVSTEIHMKPEIPKIEKTGGFAGLKNPMLNDNLGRIIRWYKGRVTFEIRKIQFGFVWQSRFYDHIIRDKKSYYIIRNYIKTNPLHWNENEFLAKL